MKSSRTSMSTSSRRRYSQPVLPSSSSSGRRGSEMVGAVKGGGDGGLPPPPPPAASSSSSQFDDKMMVVEAKGPRKSRSKEGEGPSFDADQYNPDGSLRTMYRMPDFQKSYAQAEKTRYIRHLAKHAPEMEKELAIHQIFKD